MRDKFTKIALAVVFGLSLSFAQEIPKKLAVYVSGADEAVNKSLGSKLLVAMTQSGEYVEPAKDSADYVCTVNMIEAFGDYSITARLVRTSDSQIIKIGSTDHQLKSLEDLTAVSNELASQLLPSGNQPLSPHIPAIEQKQCERTYNINELLFKIKDGFPSKLKDCSSNLAKDMLNPFGKKLEPKSFMMQCSVDGVKKELPDGFPNTDKIVGSLTNFVQCLLNSASAGGVLDPKKLVSTVGNMNIEELLSDVKKLSAVDCVVDEPYEPVAPAEDAEESDSGEENKSWVSFGIRAGLNSSYVYAEYDILGEHGSGDYGDINGMQVGFVVDFALSNWFHIQPGLMYIWKGMMDADYDRNYDREYSSHYIELPLMLSLKLAALRLNGGIYYGFCVGSYGDFYQLTDFGLSTGVGFDIGMFYIGTFYDYGLTDVRKKNGFNFYNRTLGFNLGVNL